MRGTFLRKRNREKILRFSSSRRSCDDISGRPADNRKAEYFGIYIIQSWKSLDIQDPRVICLSDPVRILAYRVTEMRKGRGLYKALISSTYILNYNEWKLIFHQHTPE